MALLPLALSTQGHLNPPPPPCVPLPGPPWGPLGLGRVMEEGSDAKRKKMKSSKRGKAGQVLSLMTKAQLLPDNLLVKEAPAVKHHVVPGGTLPY